MLSDAYARDSQWPEGERPSPVYFAVARGPLTPNQYGSALVFAAADPEHLAKPKTPEHGLARFADLEKRGEIWPGALIDQTTHFRSASMRRCASVTVIRAKRPAWRRWRKPAWPRPENRGLGQAAGGRFFEYTFPGTVPGGNRDFEPVFRGPKRG